MVLLDEPEDRNCKDCKKTFSSQFSHEFYCSECWEKRMGLSSKKKKKQGPCDCSVKLKKVEQKLTDWIKLITEK